MPAAGLLELGLLDPAGLLVDLRVAGIAGVAIWPVGVALGVGLAQLLLVGGGSVGLRLVLAHGRPGTRAPPAPNGYTALCGVAPQGDGPELGLALDRTLGPGAKAHERGLAAGAAGEGAG